MDAVRSTITVRFEDRKVDISEIVAKILERKVSVEEMTEISSPEGGSSIETGQRGHRAAFS